MVLRGGLIGFWNSPSMTQQQTSRVWKLRFGLVTSLLSVANSVLLAGGSVLFEHRDHKELLTNRKFQSFRGTLGWFRFACSSSSLISSPSSELGFIEGFLNSRVFHE